MSWIVKVLRDIFCGKMREDYEEMLEKYKAQLDECSKNMKEMINSIASLKAQIEELNKQIEELEEDVKYWRDRAEHFMNALSKAVEIPDISDLIGEKEIVKPWTEFNWKGYDFLAPDVEYYAFPKEVWEEILSRVYKEKEEHFGEWKREVFDCDDHALTMASLVVMTFEKAKLDRQGAFFIIWSPRHAYNGFIDNTRRIWIYEPQTNEIVGILGETPDPYNSRWLWILGKKVEG